jgi:hypothetical protein
MGLSLLPCILNEVLFRAQSIEWLIQLCPLHLHFSIS